MPELSALGLRAAQETRTIRVRVLDWQGQPVPGCEVAVYEEDSAPTGMFFPIWSGQGAITDASGIATLLVRNGWRNHHVCVSRPEARADLYEGPSAGSAWRPEDCTMRFQRGYEVSGVVRDAAGKPIRARVSYKPVGSWFGSTWDFSDEQGRFSRRMPYGPVDLGAQPSEPASRDWPKRWVSGVTPEHPTMDLELGEDR